MAWSDKNAKDLVCILQCTDGQLFVPTLLMNHSRVYLIIGDEDVFPIPFNKEKVQMFFDFLASNLKVPPKLKISDLEIIAKIGDYLDVVLCNNNHHMRWSMDNFNNRLQDYYFREDAKKGNFLPSKPTWSDLIECSNKMLKFYGGDRNIDEMKSACQLTNPDLIERFRKLEEYETREKTIPYEQYVKECNTDRRLF